MDEVCIDNVKLNTTLAELRTFTRREKGDVVLRVELSDGSTMDVTGIHSVHRKDEDVLVLETAK